MTVALIWLAFVVRNNWSTFPVLLGLVVFGVGQGSLVTLLFNVLVTASPKELAGDVGSLRGTPTILRPPWARQLRARCWSACLSASIMSSLADNPYRRRLFSPRSISTTSLSSATIGCIGDGAHDGDAGAGGGGDARQHRGAAAGVKIGFVIMAGLALLSIIPAGRLPGYRPGELPSTLRRKMRHGRSRPSA